MIDGELTFYAADDSEVGECREEIMQTMEGGRRRILEATRRTQSPLMTFEFKSLSSPMTAVPALGDFEWTYCGSPEHPCSNPKHQKMGNEVAAIEPGPDALRPPWNIRSPPRKQFKSHKLRQHHHFFHKRSLGPFPF